MNLAQNIFLASKSAKRKICGTVDALEYMCPQLLLGKGVVFSKVFRTRH